MHAKLDKQTTRCSFSDDLSNGINKFYRRSARNC